MCTSDNAPKFVCKECLPTAGNRFSARHKISAVIFDYRRFGSTTLNNQAGIKENQSAISRVGGGLQFAGEFSKHVRSLIFNALLDKPVCNFELLSTKGKLQKPYSDVRLQLTCVNIHLQGAVRGSRADL